MLFPYPRQRQRQTYLNKICSCSHHSANVTFRVKWILKASKYRYVVPLVWKKYVEEHDKMFSTRSNKTNKIYHNVHSFCCQSHDRSIAPSKGSSAQSEI
jgi:hypothetical protein